MPTSNNVRPKLECGGPTTGKSVQCSICSKRFSRTDHLKRHQLRHSGIKPYSCIFCGDGFTRSDNLRDHYPSCPQRRDRQIPEAARGGRRSHACDSCTAMKLGCDGKSPCNTCRQKNIDCKFERLESKGVVVKSEAQKAAQDGNSDRGSISFLLNAGTASFIDCFRLPSSHERRNLFNFRQTQHPGLSPVEQFGGSDTGSASTFSNIDTGSGSTFSNIDNGSVSAFSSIDAESIDWSLFDDENLMRFLSSPFTFSNEAAPPLCDISFPGEWEPASVQSAAIVQAILERAMYLHVSPQEQANISQHLNFIFTPSRIQRFVQTAFEFWHPHCPIIHPPSFNIETAPLPLLSVVTVIGALYSKDDQDVVAAKFILDLVEFYVFSIDDMTEEFEIRQMLRSDSLMSSPLAMPHLQAAYIIVCVQFWAGSMVSRKRAMDTRFGTVVKVARRLNLTKARHHISDSQNELLWIQVECQIRLIYIIALFDSAVLFFANYPTRLFLPELNFDLNCEERFFASPHPFAEPGFSPCRNILTFDAFQHLFGKGRASDSVPSVVGNNKVNPFGLNPTDMFLLIHLLYVYTHTQLTLFLPVIPPSPQASYSAIPAPASESGSTTPQAAPLQPSVYADNMTQIKGALAKWHALWVNIRTNTPKAAWADLGIFRNGYNYWLITQLVISSRGSSDILIGTEVGCEDTLGMLRSLVREGGVGSVRYE